MNGFEPTEFIDPRTLPFAEPGCRGDLPHLYKENGTYFVTFRLWDAVWLDAKPTAEAQKTAEDVAASSEPPLRLGSCLLADTRAAAVVADAFRFFHGERYHLFAWCVMPNHCHAVYAAFGEWTPKSIHHSWKSFTVHRINRLLGRRGPVWERESFDHLIRSTEDCERFIRYVEENSVAAGPCRRPEDWPYSSASRAV